MSLTQNDSDDAVEAVEETPTERPTSSSDGLVDQLLDTPVGKSIFRSPRRHTPRDRAAGHWASFLMHIYPVKVRRKELGFRYTWYLGVISTVLLGSLVFSGIYLMFFYVPSPANAYTLSLIHI